MPKHVAMHLSLYWLNAEVLVLGRPLWCTGIRQYSTTFTTSPDCCVDQYTVLLIHRQTAWVLGVFGIHRGVSKSGNCRLALDETRSIVIKPLWKSSPLLSSVYMDRYDGGMFWFKAISRFVSGNRILRWRAKDASLCNQKQKPYQSSSCWINWKIRHHWVGRSFFN